MNDFMCKADLPASHNPSGKLTVILGHKNCCLSVEAAHQNMHSVFMQDINHALIILIHNSAFPMH